MSKQAHDDRQRGRRDQGGANALQSPARKQHFLVLRQSRQQRSRGEYGEPGCKDAAGAEQVAQPSAQQQQAAKGDDVGVEDPA
ncbi:hypothetical protein D3C72_1216360 [compost metagenome]